jgi:hypothetical protein
MTIMWLSLAVGDVHALTVTLNCMTGHHIIHTISAPRSPSGVPAPLVWHRKMIVLRPTLGGVR